MKIISVPNIRQTYNYDCGATALQIILVYYGIEIRKDHIIKATKTSKNGASIKEIVKAANKYGLKTSSKEMNINDIKDYIKENIPVILSLQAWTQKKTNWEDNRTDGHYVVAIGYTKDKIIFADPSSFVHTYLSYDELDKRWHDIDIKGKKYYHHGIAVFGKKPKFKKNEIIHMG